MWVAIACLASILWGLTYTLDKKVLSFMSVLELAAIYYTSSAVLCWALVMQTSSVKTVMEKTFATGNTKWVVGACICAFVANLSIMRSVQLSNATLAALIEIAYPLFTVLFSYWILKEVTLTKDVFIGGALIFAGVIYISVKT
ncbi:MAG: EamA family transporter [Bdellovibrionales bacterium]